MKTFLSRFFYVFSLGIFLFLGSVPSAFASENISKFIPVDNFIYMNFDFNEDNWEPANRHKVFYDWELWAPVRNLIHELEKDTSLKIDDQILYKVEKAGFALSLPDLSVLMEGKLPPMVGILKFRAPNIASEMLTGLLTSYQANKGNISPLEDYRGCTVYKLDAAKDISLYITTFGNYFIVCNTDDFLKNCLDVYAKSKQSLEDSPVFNKIYAKSAAEKAMWLYFNSEALLARLGPFLPMIPEADQSLASFKMYKAFGAGVGFVDNGLEIKSYMVLNPNNPDVKAILGKSSEFKLPAKLTPPKPYMYASLVGLKESVKYLNEFRNIELGGADLNLDVLFNIVKLSDEVSMNIYESVGQEESNMLLPNMTLFCKIKDKARVENELRKFRILTKNNHSIKFGNWLAYRHRNIRVVNRVNSEPMNFRPAYTFLGDYLILGLYPGSVMRSIDLYDKLLPSLSENIDFDEMTMRLGKRNLSSIGYSDFGEVTSFFQKLATVNPDTQQIIPFLETINKIGFNSQNDGKDGAVSTLLINLNWDKIDLRQLFGINN